VAEFAEPEPKGAAAAGRPETRRKIQAQATRAGTISWGRTWAGGKGGVAAKGEGWEATRVKPPKIWLACQVSAAGARIKMVAVMAPRRPGSLVAIGSTTPTTHKKHEAEAGPVRPSRPLRRCAEAEGRTGRTASLAGGGRGCCFSAACRCGSGGSKQRDGDSDRITGSRREGGGAEMTRCCGLRGRNGKCGQ
jgi:hypothetical protein